MASNSTKKSGTAGKGVRKPAAKSTKKTTNKNTVKTAARNTSRKAEKEAAVLQDVKTETKIREKTNPLIMRETILIGAAAICVLMYISFFGMGGYVGDAITEFCFGIFGLFAYLFPLLLFLTFAFFLSNKGNDKAGLRFGAFAVLYVCLCGFAALGAAEFRYSVTLTQIYEDSASYKSGGGVIGGGLCSMLKPAIGTVGTALFFLVLLVICLILITQKSLLRIMRRQSSRIYTSARESTARMRESHLTERRKERERIADRRQNSQSGLIEEDDILSRNSREIAVYSDRDRNAGKNRSTEKVKKGRRYREDQREYRQRMRESEHRQQMMRERRQNHEDGLDIPITFQAKGRDGRMAQRVSGVTDNTIILQTTPKAVQEVHEIMPDLTFEAPETETRVAEFHIDGITEEQAAVPKQPVTSPERTPKKVRQIKTDIKLDSTSEQIRQIQSDTMPEILPEEVLEDTEPKQPSGSSNKKNPRSSKEEIAEGVAAVAAQAEAVTSEPEKEYVFPPIDLLKRAKSKSGSGNQAQEIRETAAKLQQTLNSFGVHATVVNASCGPTVTRYELMPEQGVKVSRIVSLSNDIKLNLAAADIRIEAPIPGKAAVGIEVPNAESAAVGFRELIESEEFQNSKSNLSFATGRDISGRVIVSDIAKMPHVLIAGATGSGKSVCINTLIMSILYKAKPEDVKLIMVDPKVVELSVYNDIPHLLIPVVTDPKKASDALNWAVQEMMDRYQTFADIGVRNLEGYNQRVEAIKDIEEENKPKKLPQIVIIVDELADLMMVAPGEVEDAICRLAQLARAAGIHLVIATQRPSVNVITGKIKANLPSRIAFSVMSGVDSRTIIDMFGAEKLLGKGDMLFYPQGYKMPERVQGAFVSDEEVADVVDFLKANNSANPFRKEMEAKIAGASRNKASAESGGGEDKDALFPDAGKLIIEKDKASIGMLQRYFKIGFNRAARIMDQLADAGVVGPEEGTKPRKILMAPEQFDNYLEENG